MLQPPAYHPQASLKAHRKKGQGYLRYAAAKYRIALFPPPTGSFAKVFTATHSAPHEQPSTLATWNVPAMYVNPYSFSSPPGEPKALASSLFPSSEQPSPLNTYGEDAAFLLQEGGSIGPIVSDKLRNCAEDESLSLSEKRLHPGSPTEYGSRLGFPKATTTGNLVVDAPPRPRSLDPLSTHPEVSCHHLLAVLTHGTAVIHAQRHHPRRILLYLFGTHSIQSPMLVRLQLLLFYMHSTQASTLITDQRLRLHLVHLASPLQPRLHATPVSDLRILHGIDIAASLHNCYIHYFHIHQAICEEDISALYSVALCFATHTITFHVDLPGVEQSIAVKRLLSCYDSVSFVQFQCLVHQDLVNDYFLDMLAAKSVVSLRTTRASLAAATSRLSVGAVFAFVTGAEGRTLSLSDEIDVTRDFIDAIIESAKHVGFFLSLRYSGSLNLDKRSFPEATSVKELRASVVTYSFDDIKLKLIHVSRSRGLTIHTLFK